MDELCKRSSVVVVVVGGGGGGGGGGTARGAGGGTAVQAPGFSPRNLVCLRALVAAALFLAGKLGFSWFAVLEALQNADYVLTTRGTAPPARAALGATSEDAVKAW